MTPKDGLKGHWISFSSKDHIWRHLLSQLFTIIVDLAYWNWVIEPRFLGPSGPGYDLKKHGSTITLYVCVQFFVLGCKSLNSGLQPWNLMILGVVHGFIHGSWRCSGLSVGSTIGQHWGACDSLVVCENHSYQFRVTELKSSLSSHTWAPVYTASSLFLPFQGQLAAACIFPWRLFLPWS